MKSFRTRSFVIGGSATVLIGAILLFTGYRMGGANKIISFQNGWPTTIDTTLKTQTLSLSDNTKKIKIDADALKITVQVADEFSIKSQLRGGRDLILKSSGNSETISTNENFNASINFGFLQKGEESLLVTVPSKDQLTDLEINSDAGSTNIQDLQLSTLTGQADAANITLQNVSAQSFSFSADASHLSFTGLTLKKASSITMDAGNLTLNQCTIPGLKVGGDASSFTLNGIQHNLPYQQGAEDKALKISGDASDFSVTN